MAYQTEYPFTLPRGYMDESGTVHREGTMRFATWETSRQNRRRSRCSMAMSSSYPQWR